MTKNEPEKKLRVLVVDDDLALLETMQAALRARDYVVQTATNGKEALQIAHSQPLDLILLDVMMPYMDGYHVAHEISSKLGVNAPKLLLITGRDTERERGVALMSGADDVIQKPFSMEALQEKIEKVLRGDQGEEHGQGD